MSKTTAPAARASLFFVHFSAVRTQLQRGIFNFFLVDGLKNWNDKAINLFTISLWTRTRSPLFSSNLTHVPCFQFTGRLVMRAKKDAKSIFQRRFHWRLCFRIVRSLLDCIVLCIIVLCIGSCTLLKHQYFQTMIWDKPPGNCRPQNCRPRCLTQGSSAN